MQYHHSWNFLNAPRPPRIEGRREEGEKGGRGEGKKGMREGVEKGKREEGKEG